MPRDHYDPMNGGIYLARTFLGRPRFSVRQSVAGGGGYLRHRELFDLGHDPGQFLLYPFDNYFYIRDDLVQAVAAQVEGDAVTLLEKILLPFIRQDLRLKLETSLDRQQSRNRRAVSAGELAEIARELHLFDRRRLHYLWYGAIDQSRLFRMPAKLSRRLLGKSRDEKEQYFIGLEQVLQPAQMKEYLFTVFNLPHYFTDAAARFQPRGLAPEQVDAFFLEELCRLNGDPLLWQGLETGEGLQPYLVRYLILFFDYDFGESEALNNYIRQFMDSHRQFRFPERRSVASPEEVSELFGESLAQLANLSKRELTKLFRQRAKQLHPDTGGDPEHFVRLKEAFEELRRQR